MQQTQRCGLPEAGDAVEPIRILLPSPLGPLGLELRQMAVTRLVFDPAEAERAAFTPLHALDGSELLDEICGRLSEYLAGARRRLEIAFNLVPCGCTGLARRVLKEAAKIPYGRTRTYQAIADLTGRPEAHLQVRSILLANPIPIVIACHRVLAEDGSLGDYVGGVERQRWLLAMESSARTAC
jgi:methylated-DNA-[protein]-cysteine S-methyltransferase